MVVALKPDSSISAASVAFSGEVREQILAGEARLGHFSPSQAAAWRQGQLVADDLPIAEVVAQLKRYVPGLIVLRDDAGLASKRVTGVYDLRHPEAALRAVVQPHGGRVERYSAWVLVVR